MRRNDPTVWEGGAAAQRLCSVGQGAVQAMKDGNNRGGRRAPRGEEVEGTRRADVDVPQQHELELRVASVAAHDKHVVADGLPATAAAGRRSEKER